MQSCGLGARAQAGVVCANGARGAEHSGRHSVDFPACQCFVGLPSPSRSTSSSARVCLRTTGHLSTYPCIVSPPRLVGQRPRGLKRTSKNSMPRAAVATDSIVADTPAAEFHVDGGQLKIKVGPSVVELEVGLSNASNLTLHWGATKPNEGNWYLPSRRPPGTRDFNQQALQTPFQKVGDVFQLRIEVAEVGFQAIEFLLLDESRNHWFKNNGGNFRTEIPSSSPEDISKIVIPEDLVPIQAYLRWERNGKQNYSPDQERREFEEARKELQLEVRNGTKIEDIRKRLGAGGGSGTNGSSSKTSAPSTPSRTARSSGGRINRSRRDPLELLSLEVGKKSSTPAPPREPTALEVGAEAMAESDKGAVISRKIYKLGDSDLLVLVTNPDGEVRVRLASNMQQTLSILWALSKNHPREWQAPPEESVPENSTLLEASCESPFTKGFAGDSSLQAVEIVVSEGEYIGMPFVLKEGSIWYKDNGGDYYLALKAPDVKELKVVGDGSGTAKRFLEDIANVESEAQRSLMHRYNIATGLTEQAKREGELAIVGILVWLRYMASRQLIWNKSYNVKPREISAAQDRLTDLLQSMYREEPEHRELIRLIMSTVGRGGQGDVGQRIRDEILVVQRNNDCKGGMMEEWHQKLHNNTSPDDVVICQALLDHIQSDFNMDVYWKTLNANGVTKQRLASYDRPIVSEPRLNHGEKDSLIRDLTAYLRTLKAVHSGADLESAIASCMGYSAQGQGFMGGVEIRPVGGLSQELPGLLQFVMEHVEDKESLPLLEALVEARRQLWATLQKPHDRLRDIIFLDLALDSTVRTTVERGLEGLDGAGLYDLALIISMIVENLCMSSNNNEELVYCLKDWYNVMDLVKNKPEDWALRSKAVLDRTRLALQEKGEYYQKLLQPSAEYLGSLLGVEQWAIDIFTEEMIRSGSAASLSLVLNRMDPVLRKEAHMGSWQVISPVETQGYVVVVDELLDVADQVYEKPTILIAGRVRGEEEIPDGVVAVLTPDMPDILSHVSVRARNGKVCFATCFDPEVLASLRSKSGKAIKLEPTAADLNFSEVNDADVVSASDPALTNIDESHGITLKRKVFAGKYAVAADAFTPDLVGAKSRNIANLRGQLPASIRLPTSVALPFGSFEKVLSESINKDVAQEIASLTKELSDGDFHKLKDIRDAVLNLQAPPKLVEELKAILKSSDMPWPGDEGEERWEQAWTAIKKVWGSKWNERAYFSTRKAKIDHKDLCMAVLVQEIIQADYAYVIHTENPSTGNKEEIYAEVVKGLGETLVGAYSGRALSFVANKSDLKSPKILGYPSKRVGLFIKRSLIFRSDSNGEDLEGYAGAGLYDSVPMDHEEERVVDYATDPLTQDDGFRTTILRKIIKAGSQIEKLLGSAQDIEGVIKDGELYVVQTRPQM